MYQSTKDDLIYRYVIHCTDKYQEGGDCVEIED